LEEKRNKKRKKNEKMSNFGLSPANRLLSLSVPIKEKGVSKTPAQIPRPSCLPVATAPDQSLKSTPKSLAYSSFSHVDNMPLNDALRFFVAENELSHKRYPDEGARILPLRDNCSADSDASWLLACVSRTSLAQREIAHPFLDGLRFAAAHGSAFVLNPDTLWHLVSDSIAYFFQHVEPVAKRIYERRHTLGNGQRPFPPMHYLNVEPKTLAADNPLDGDAGEVVRDIVLSHQRHYIVSTPPSLAAMMANTSTAAAAFSDEKLTATSSEKMRRLEEPPQKCALDMVSERVSLPIVMSVARNFRYTCQRGELDIDDADDSDDDDHHIGGETTLLRTTYRVRQYEIERKAGEWMRLFCNVLEFVVYEPLCDWLAPLLCIVYGVLLHHRRLMKETDEDYPKFTAAAEEIVNAHAAQFNLTLHDLSADLASFFWCDELRRRKHELGTLHLHGLALYLFPAACGMMSQSQANKDLRYAAEMRMQHRDNILNPSSRALSSAMFVNELRVFDYAVQTPIKVVCLRNYTGFVGFVYHPRKNAVAPTIQSFAVVEKETAINLANGSFAFGEFSASAKRNENKEDVFKQASQASNADIFAEKIDLDRRVAAQTGAAVRDMIRLLDLNGGSTQVTFSCVDRLGRSRGIETATANHWPVSHHENVERGRDFAEFERQFIFEHWGDKLQQKAKQKEEEQKEEDEAKETAQETTVLPKDLAKNAKIDNIDGQVEEPKNEKTADDSQRANDGSKDDLTKEIVDKEARRLAAAAAKKERNAAALKQRQEAAAEEKAQRERDKERDKRAQQRAAEERAKERAERRREHELAEQKRREQREVAAQERRERKKAERAERKRIAREWQEAEEAEAAKRAEKAEQDAEEKKRAEEKEAAQEAAQQEIGAEAVEDAGEQTVEKHKVIDKERNDDKQSVENDTASDNDSEIDGAALLTLSGSSSADNVVSMVIDDKNIKEETNGEERPVETTAANNATKEQITAAAPSRQFSDRLSIVIKALRSDGFTDFKANSDGANTGANSDDTENVVVAAVERFARRCMPPTALSSLEAPLHTCQAHRLAAGAGAVPRNTLYAQIAATCDKYFPCGACCAERNEWYWTQVPAAPFFTTVEQSTLAGALFAALFDTISGNSFADTRSRRSSVSALTACVYCKCALDRDSMRTSLLFNGVDFGGEARLRILWHCAERCDGSFDNLPFAPIPMAALLENGQRNPEAPMAVARGLAATCFGSTTGKTYLRLQCAQGTASLSVLDDILFEIKF
jgi:hypothetical protein